jgi:hypothetical protein
MCTGDSMCYGSTPMAEYGFWNLAQQDPAHLALVTPEGEELTAGALLARANRIVHGLRALGLSRRRRHHRPAEQPP